jgi:hypothetical protein
LAACINYLAGIIKQGCPGTSHFHPARKGGMDFFDWFCVVFWTSTLLFVGFLFFFGG